MCIRDRHTGGQNKNVDDCRCGNKYCTSATGLYCRNDLNLCSKVEFGIVSGYTYDLQDCDHTDGITRNNNACRCGNGFCESGSFCEANINKCSMSEFYQHVFQGVESIEDCTDGDFTEGVLICQCGANYCTEDTGFMCNQGKSICGFGSIEEKSEPFVDCEKGSNDINVCRCGSDGYCDKNTNGNYCLISGPSYHNSPGKCARGTHNNVTDITDFVSDKTFCPAFGKQNRLSGNNVICNNRYLENEDNFDLECHSERTLFVNTIIIKKRGDTTWNNIVGTYNAEQNITTFEKDIHKTFEKITIQNVGSTSCLCNLSLIHI